MEVYKKIPEFDGYEVSSLGNIKSLKGVKERILNPTKNKYGYLYVSLCKEGKVKKFQVHQVIAMGFLGHKPSGHALVVDHINNIKTDNRVSNLQVITHRENDSKEKKGSSKYTGVHWNKKKWCANIRINGIKKYLGRFHCEREAGKAYQNALKNI